ncbi:hypothetical protein NX02_03475 [Sphingomonas sanxanigenens DSM 19645 = NX02]|uniref:Uncharacterized protein n=1 Tax=Sphingomonas sanxanigenens DSM 19645 = NX02 TaxID=1123269 RepID=W0A3B7_9SPHN|nr:hypothetical protein NX02_03475 [Sphingomonas sanxanigenens DSM 19645 = NX02]
MYRRAGQTRERDRMFRAGRERAAGASLTAMDGVGHDRDAGQRRCDAARPPAHPRNACFAGVRRLASQARLAYARAVSRRPGRTRPAGGAAPGFMHFMAVDL